MSASMRRLIVLTMCLGLILYAKPAKAESIGAAVAEVIIGIVVGTAAITTAIVLTIRHNPSVTGCASSGPDGLELERDQQRFLLLGDTADIKPGERVKVQGKIKASNAANKQRFVVMKFKKDYGPCR